MIMSECEAEIKKSPGIAGPVVVPSGDNH